MEEIVSSHSWLLVEKIENFLEIFEEFFALVKMNTDVIWMVIRW